MKSIEEMKVIDTIIITLFILLIFIPVLLLLSPFLIIYAIITWIKYKHDLKKVLLEYDGKIIFLYGAYHEFNFSTYFDNHPSGIKCLEVSNHFSDDILIAYLTRKRKANSLPQLVKIEGKNTIVKQHYSSFKHYVKRNNDTDNFFKLIESSIKNLEKSTL